MKHINKILLGVVFAVCSSNALAAPVSYNKALCYAAHDAAKIIAQARFQGAPKLMMSDALTEPVTRSYMDRVYAVPIPDVDKQEQAAVDFANKVERECHEAKGTGLYSQ